MTIPPPALEVRDDLDGVLHRSDRRVGVITWGHQRGLWLAILTGADDADAARRHALRLVTAALAGPSTERRSARLAR
jgi:hypothetical protein